MTYREFAEVIEHLSRTEYLYLGAAAIVLAFLLLLLVRRQPKQIVAYSTDEGQVYVARSAIRELVQSACEQLEGVSKPHTRIIIRGSRAHFEVKVKLVGTCRLRDIESTLQRHMRTALSENLGIEKLGRINVIATGFKSGRVEEATVRPRRDEPVGENLLPERGEESPLAKSEGADAPVEGNQGEDKKPG